MAASNFDPIAQNITPMVALEVLHHEAIIRQAYKDGGGVWTWSGGLTGATGHNVEKYIGKPQPMKYCLEVYFWALEKYADTVRRVFDGRDLTEAQFAAALSFHWNTGAISRASWVKSWKAGNTAKAYTEFMNYRKPASIIERREKERDLFFSAKWSSRGTVGEYTKLTSRSTPIWSSRVERDIRAEINAILAPAPIIPANPLAAFIAAIIAIFKGLTR